MAQFTIYFPTQEALDRDSRFPSTYRARFIGWDTMGGISTEATLAESLNQRMNQLDVETFKKLDGGERITRGGMVYEKQ